VGIAIARGRFGEARRVVELGCGTGRVAEELLAQHLPADAEYLGIDLSREMVRLARARLARFGERARVRLTPGALPLPEPDGWADRFLSTYVFDLLSEDEIRAVLAEAKRLLRPGGLLCVVGLSTGAGPVSRLVAAAWSGLHRLSPELVGGCRPVEMEGFVRAQEGLALLHHERVSAFGVPSEALVAERR
jgi:ubiquinone/menaquinone biosynthesis C-methylase UbiE